MLRHHVYTYILHVPLSHIASGTTDYSSIFFLLLLYGFGPGTTCTIFPSDVYPRMFSSLSHRRQCLRGNSQLFREIYVLNICSSFVSSLSPVVAWQMRYPLAWPRPLLERQHHAVRERSSSASLANLLGPTRDG